MTAKGHGFALDGRTTESFVPRMIKIIREKATDQSNVDINLIHTFYFNM